MKTINSKLIIGFAIITGLVILISSFKTGDTAKKYLTVAVFKTGMKFNTKIIIISNGVKTEEFDGASGFGLDDQTNNAILVNQTINKITAKDYHLVSTISEPNYGVQFFFEEN